MTLTACSRLRAPQHHAAATSPTLWPQAPSASMPRLLNASTRATWMANSSGLRDFRAFDVVFQVFGEQGGQKRPAADAHEDLVDPARTRDGRFRLSGRLPGPCRPTGNRCRKKTKPIFSFGLSASPAIASGASTSARNASRDASRLSGVSPETTRRCARSSRAWAAETVTRAASPTSRILQPIAISYGQLLQSILGPGGQDQRSGR